MNFVVTIHNITQHQEDPVGTATVQYITCEDFILQQDLSLGNVSQKSASWPLLVEGFRSCEEARSFFLDALQSGQVTNLSFYNVDESLHANEDDGAPFTGAPYTIVHCASTDALQTMKETCSDRWVDGGGSIPLLALTITQIITSDSSIEGSKTSSAVPQYQRLPACAICLRRLRRLQPYTNYCVARSFAITNYRTCKICTAFQHTQSGDPSTRPLSCTACHLQQNLWICLTCGYVGCGRYSQQHAQLHAHHSDHADLHPPVASSMPSASSSSSLSMQPPTSDDQRGDERIAPSLSNHSWALELATGRIWDYSLDDYAHYENDHQLLLHPSPLLTDVSVDDTLVGGTVGASAWLGFPSAPHQYRAFSFAEARDCLMNAASDGSKVLLVSKASLFPATSSSSLLSATSTLDGHTSKLDRIAAEYECLMEQQLQEQQLHFDKLIARETVRALQAQCAATQSHQAHPPSATTSATKGGASKGAAAVTRPSKASAVMGTVNGDVALDAEAADSVLREIERLKIEVSAAEADQAQLLLAFKAQDEATRETKQRCDQLLRRQRQLQQLEEALVQREKDTRVKHEAELDDLKQQFRDLSFYLETQSNKEINGGSMVVSAPTPTSATTNNDGPLVKSRSSGRKK